jgi:hypothetical protein
MMAEQHARQSEEEHWLRRSGRNHRGGPPRPRDRYRTAEMKCCHDHATAGRAGSGGDGTASSTSQGEAAVQLGEVGCSQPDE